MSITPIALTSVLKAMFNVMDSVLLRKNVVLYLDKEQERLMWPVPTTTMKIQFISQ